MLTTENGEETRRRPEGSVTVKAAYLRLTHHKKRPSKLRYRTEYSVRILRTLYMGT